MPFPINLPGDLGGLDPKRVALARNLLGALLPPGFTDWFDDSPGSFLDGILGGTAEMLVAVVLDGTDAISAANNPATLSDAAPWGYDDWETALALIDTPTAQAGTLAQRQGAILARLREHGASTLPNVESAVLGLGVSEVAIAECNRAALTTAHTYTNATVTALPPSSTTTITITVADDSQVAEMGAQLTLALTHSHIEQLSVTLIGPNGTYGQATHTWAALGTGSAPLAITLCAVDAAEKSIAGAWTVAITTGAASGTLNSASLFVEGIGRDATDGDGLGEAMFEWGVIVPNGDLASTGVTFDQLLTLARRWNPAHCTATVVRGQLLTGLLPAIPDDPNCVPNQCIPG